jgi:hypothetical protein
MRRSAAADRCDRAGQVAGRTWSRGSRAEHRYTSSGSEFITGLTSTASARPAYRYSANRSTHRARNRWFSRREQGLDIIQRHYAVPHATAAYLAKQILLPIQGRARSAEYHDAPWTPTSRSSAATLPRETCLLDRHVGRRDRRFREPADRTLYTALSVQRPITVIPNFLTVSVSTNPGAPLRARYCPPAARSSSYHVSNFRPVKRVPLRRPSLRSCSRSASVEVAPGGDGPDSRLRCLKRRHWASVVVVEALGEAGSDHPCSRLRSLSSHVVTGEFRVRGAGSDGRECRSCVARGGLSRVIDTA